METPSMTVYQIETQIAEARERLASLDREAQDLAMPTVSGDQDAAASLAGINVQVQQITADIAVLERARLTAARQQREACEASAAADRARNLQIARVDAAKIIALAGQADQLIAAFDAVIADLETVEQHLWRALAQAAAQPSDAIVGRRGIGTIALARMCEVTDRRNKQIRQQRPVAAVASLAWKDLLGADEVSDV